MKTLYYALLVFIFSMCLSTSFGKDETPESSEGDTIQAPIKKGKYLRDFFSPELSMPDKTAMEAKQSKTLRSSQSPSDSTSFSMQIPEGKRLPKDEKGHTIPVDSLKKK